VTETSDAGEGAGVRGDEQRQDLYCLIPPDLARRLGSVISRHAEQHGAVGIVDRRLEDRRSGEDRRESFWPGGDTSPLVLERRHVRNRDGRRVGERRATLIPVQPVGTLPRRLRDYADRIVFVEPLELGEEQVEDIDTARLVTRWQGGDQAVLEQLYLRYFDRIYTYLRLALSDRRQAEEVTQDVFLRVMDVLPVYELHQAPFRSWLFRIVRACALAHLQGSRDVPAIEELEQLDRRREEGRLEPLDDSVLDRFSDADVLILVGRLPLFQRQVMMLRYMLDLTAHEIGAILDRPPAAVRDGQELALGSLRERLAKLGKSTQAAGARAALPMQKRLRLAPVISARRRALLLP
jgi:RNA polymerase sigma-70 factor (ECF subfamily)